MKPIKNKILLALLFIIIAINGYSQIPKSYIIKKSPCEPCATGTTYNCDSVKNCVNYVPNIDSTYWVFGVDTIFTPHSTGGVGNINVTSPIIGNGTIATPIALNANNDLGVQGGFLQQGFPLVRNTDTDLAGFNRTWRGTGRIGISNNIGFTPATTSKVHIQNTLTQPTISQYALQLNNDQTNTAVQPNDRYDLFINTTVNNGGFTNSGRQCAIAIANTYNGTGQYTNIRNFQNAIVLNSPLSGGGHILNHNNFALNSGLTSGGTLIGTNVMGNSALGANINNLIFYNAEFSPVWNGNATNIYGFRIMQLPVSGFTKGYAIHSADVRARVVLPLPVYINTATAGADATLDTGQFFRVSNGDGTSQVHIKQ